MRLTPTTFLGAFHDGLLEVPGHEFECAGRLFVVHRGREPYDKMFRVSDKESGFAVPIANTRDRRVAANLAVQALAAVSAVHLARAVRGSLRARATLARIPTPASSPESARCDLTNINERIKD